MKKLILSIIAFTILFSHCTKIIDIDLNTTDPKIIVEASINNQNGPYKVKLSKTVNFDQKNTYPPISNAIVTLTDDVNTDTLIEQKPGEYYSQNITGKTGKSYNLYININGEIITAKSTMPEIVPLDTITFLVSNFGPGRNEDEDIYVPIPHFKDPSKLGNYYRFKITVNDTLDKTFYVDNDDLINGLEYQRPQFGNDIFINKGDKLLFEMQCIDKATFDYFTSLNASIGEGPGGGTTPANPTTNLVGNATGFFSAHTKETKFLIVK
ncbi:MAG: DUF4249 domain-containing protein [Saprospiraceae bacterium]|nr:DUF4249 domain-containing protein [Saprospiraceae bacterium]